jgi:hypothetical protein
MRLLPFLIAIPAVCAANEGVSCAFVVGHATVGTASSNHPSSTKAEWFVVSGRAEVVIQGSHLTARFFDSRLGGDLSHTFKATFRERSAPSKVRRHTSLQAVLRTMHTDSGDDGLTGSMLVTKNMGESFRSLVAHNASSFVGITCFG